MKKVSIRGPIIPSNHQWFYDWFEMEATSPKKVADQLEQANNEDIEVEINSGGGSVFDASEIYSMLRDYQGQVIVKIIGIAASAASVIAMAGNKILMSPTGQMMIHNASTSAWGDYREMDHTSEFLQSVNQTIANAYRIKTGKPYEELLSMMDHETWMTAQRALELGFIDEIMFDDEIKLAASYTNSQLLPQKVIDKLRSELFRQARVEGQVQNTKKGETDVKLTLEQLKNGHPDLYNQVFNEGRDKGVLEERQRIKAIDEIAMPGNEELINQAKYETGVSAEQVAIEIIKAEKQRGENYLKNRTEDASELNDVGPSAAPQNNEDKEAQSKKAAEEIAAAINKRRGNQ